MTTITRFDTALFIVGLAEAGTPDQQEIDHPSLDPDAPSTVMNEDPVIDIAREFTVTWATMFAGGGG